jgi:hypothetical protein
LQDVDIHPTERLLASGVIDGHLVLHSFSMESTEQRHKVKVRRHELVLAAVSDSGAGGGSGGGGS